MRTRRFTLISTSTSKGFTLIELLVVIAIIGLLASTVIASLSSARVKARDARRIADLRSIRTALELYVSSNGQYPANGYWTCSFDSAAWGSLATALAPYISKLPTDPRNTGYPWATGTYGYCYGRISAQEYDLVTQLEDTNSPYRCALNGWLARFANPDQSWCAIGFSSYIYTDH